MKIRDYEPVIIGAGAFVVLGVLAPDASLLPALLMFAAVVQGLFALAAAAELSQGRWFRPARNAILSLHSLLFILPIGFISFSDNVSFYGWSEHPTLWLSPSFFVTRNVLMLFVTWGVGYRFAMASLTGSKRAPLFAVLYSFAFVANQSLIAFDWVMSFDYPWISTLFGGYFFIEAMFLGLAVLSLLCMRLKASGRAESQQTFLDASTFLFGWSLLWAGQLFAQFLVIWYGNIPEEQLFLVRRLVDSPLRAMAICVPLFLFVIPFTVLLSRKAKASNVVMTGIAALVFLGVFIERMLFLVPVAPMNPFFVVLGFIPLAWVLAVSLQRAVAAGGGTAEPA